MGAVIAGILRAGEAIGKIIAVNVIRITIAIIVQTVAGDLAGIEPHVARQIRVGVVHPGVHHGHDDGIGGGARQCPRRHKPDVRPGRAAAAIHGLARVFESPQVRKQRVIGEARHPAQIIGFRGFHGGVGA